MQPMHMVKVMADPQSSPPVTQVRIVPGCTVCGLCEDTCPEVFRIEPEAAVVRPHAPRYYRTHQLQIIQAVRECPVHVIRMKRSG
jgi:ferredoxin